MDLEGMRVILIGGTSHVGKSMVARVLAERLSWDYQSTDALARHPGRPWQTAPGREHIVAAHYTSLTVDELIADVLRHYEDNVWPLVEQLVAERIASNRHPGLVLEGSALLPDRVATLGFDNVAATWLVANADLLERRIMSESGYAAKGAQDRAAIDKFLARTLRFNDIVKDSAQRLGLTATSVPGDIDVEELAELCLAAAVAQRNYG